ncbi:hypothetical protein [Vibrio sp. 10N.239.312.D08]|uniref:hypothetical protein n=1 Tax=Vibrio sp. 10N.239.312.D08 TaxID=3229978 RepID=UPI00354BC715
MIYDTLTELAAIYGRVSFVQAHNGDYELEINGKLAIILNDKVLMTVCHSGCSDVYRTKGLYFHKHELKSDRDYLLGLVNRAYKQSRLDGVSHAA